jgi:hypothetical protein
MERGSWQYVGQIRVVNGRASVRTFLERTRTYRPHGRHAPGIRLPLSEKSPSRHGSAV